MDILIGKDQDGKTILNILRGELRFSSAVVTFLKKKESGILLNGVHATVRHCVHIGDILSVDYSDDTEVSDILPLPIPLDILYEDEDILLVNKPPKMPTHPSHDHRTDTLANAVAHLWKTRGIPFVFRAVNRLDADTSGVVLLAKNKPTAAMLSTQIAENKMQKTYFAVLHGALEPPCGEIETYMHLREGDKMKRSTCSAADAGAMHSLTRYETVYANDLFTAVLASPVTGRTHQLRLHFSSLGHPIVGDTLYGYPSEHIPRQALHASSLSFLHPRTGQHMSITAPIPPDIGSLFESVMGTRIPDKKEPTA